MRTRLDALLAKARDAVGDLLNHLRTDPQACGCDVDCCADPTSDSEIDGIVLFAGVPAEQVEAHAAALRTLGGDHAA